jgi:hypothetical protein
MAADDKSNIVKDPRAEIFFRKEGRNDRISNIKIKIGGSDFIMIALVTFRRMILVG